MTADGARAGASGLDDLNTACTFRSDIAIGVPDRDVVTLGFETMDQEGETVQSGPMAPNTKGARQRSRTCIGLTC